MKKVICTVCPKGCNIEIDEYNIDNVRGNGCVRGARYAAAEVTHPVRTVTTTVFCAGGDYARCPVRTDSPIGKEHMADAVRALRSVHLRAPVRIGDTVLSDVCGTGVNFIATRNVRAK